MFTFLKPRGVMVVDTNRRTMGRIPIHVARELISKKHAHVIQKNPTIIGLRQPGRTAQQDAAKLTNNPLKNIVSIASLFASRGSRIEALNSITFKAVNNRLSVAATNVESSFQGYVETGKNITFTHDKTTNGVCINADHAKRILSSPGEITQIHIKGGDSPGLQVGSFFIEGNSPDQFPDVQPQMKGEKKYSSTIENIAQKLHFVGKAVSMDKYKYVLSGVYFDFARQQLIGSDGCRLHMVSMGEPKEREKDPRGVIVPAKLLRIARFMTGEVKVIEGKDANNEEFQNIIFALNMPGCKDCTATFRAIDGNYPNYEDVIPRGFASKFIVKLKDLLLILSKAQLAVASSEGRTVETKFDNGQLTVLAMYGNKPLYQGIIRGLYTGSPYHCCMNVAYLIDALQTIPGDSIEILLQSKNDEAWVMRGPSGYTAVIMPVGMDK